MTTKKNEKIREALQNLVVWAGWMRKRYRTPEMGQPNTGAYLDAVTALALPEDEPAPTERCPYLHPKSGYCERVRAYIEGMGSPPNGSFAPAPSAPTTAATEERFVLASPTQAYPCTNPYHSTSGCVGRERECYTVRPAPADEGTDE